MIIFIIRYPGKWCKKNNSVRQKTIGKEETLVYNWIKGGFYFEH